MASEPKPIDISLHFELTDKVPLAHRKEFVEAIGRHMAKMMHVAGAGEIISRLAVEGEGLQLEYVQGHIEFSEGESKMA
jgi:hypothetical protein